jgi:SAM-dependent methyltransferase
MKGDERARQEYLSKREQLKPKEFWRDIDAWPLYVGRKNLRRNIFLLTCLERVMCVPGDLAEFGAWRGATTSLMAKYLADDPHGKEKLVHIFESFSGFDVTVQADKDLRSGYKGDAEELLAQLDLDGVVSAVAFHVGDICETVLDVECELSFVLIDCDVYAPSIAALRWAHNKLHPGGLILFDEYNDPAWKGETEAANEFLAEFGDEYDQEGTPVSQPSLLLVKK